MYRGSPREESLAAINIRSVRSETVKEKTKKNNTLKVCEAVREDRTRILMLFVVFKERLDVQCYIW